LSEITEEKKKILKELIRQLHAGASSQEVKEKFRKVLAGVSSIEIAKIEQELTTEGMPREEIQRLCDVHLAVFREQLEKQKMNIPLGHPINILMEEHNIMLQLAEKLSTITNKIQKTNDKSYADNDVAQLLHISSDFQDSEKHYLREENVLFPLLEKHGITEPPAIMWSEHNQIRERKKHLQNLVQTYNTIDFQRFKKQLVEDSRELNEILPNHFFKENNILFPAAIKVVTPEEWTEARREFDEIGYCCFTPPSVTAGPQVLEQKPERAEPEGVLKFENGSLSKEEVEAILDTLPVDISFVDKNDKVKYFNKADKRIFVRTKAVIGRSVQLCHPQKSIHIVNKIVEAFRKGEKDVAEFWIEKDRRLIHIRYYAVRDKDKEYLGTMELTQDVTDIKKIEGEKRLLDWQA
jgi:PAS domain S-box-containing protein